MRQQPAAQSFARTAGDLPRADLMPNPGIGAPLTGRAGAVGGALSPAQEGVRLSLGHVLKTDPRPGP